jgi:hypothetical protein
MVGTKPIEWPARRAERAARFISEVLVMTTMGTPRTKKPSGVEGPRLALSLPFRPGHVDPGEIKIVRNALSRFRVALATADHD